MSIECIFVVITEQPRIERPVRSVIELDNSPNPGELLPISNNSLIQGIIVLTGTETRQHFSCMFVMLKEKLNSCFILLKIE